MSEMKIKIMILLNLISVIKKISFFLRNGNLFRHGRRIMEQFYSPFHLTLNPGLQRSSELARTEPHHAPRVWHRNSSALQRSRTLVRPRPQDVESQADGVWHARTSHAAMVTWRFFRNIASPSAETSSMTSGL